MAQVMTPSTKPITDGQIDKAVGNYRAMLVKNRLRIPSVLAQQVLCEAAFAAEQFALLRQRIEDREGMIIRHVRVDRTRRPQEMLEATGRITISNARMVEEMPRGNSEGVDVHLFTFDHDVSMQRVAREYTRRGLKPDPYAQAALNESDPAFADNYPNVSQWECADGTYGHVAFSRWDGERKVIARRYDIDWSHGWWFAGVRD